MNNSINSQLRSESWFRSRLAPHRIALTILWLVTTTSMIVMLLYGARGTGFSALRHVLQVIYVGALLWYLAQPGPSVNLPSDPGVQVPPQTTISSKLAVLGIALLFVLNLVSADGRDLLTLLSLIASVLILFVWRREIRLGLVIQGFAIAIFAYLAGSQWVELGVLSKGWNIITSAFTVPFYIAGGLLLKRTRLGGMRLLNGQYGKALKNVCFGSLLFIPLGLINALGDPIVDLTGVREWWMPLWLPWWSGINEETWFRLFLVGLTYFLLRPAFRELPGLAVVAAVLFSGITFGVGHDRTLDHFMTTGLLYGVPLAAIFAKRDWEHAVGAHYMVNMIPALTAFLLR